MSPKKVRLTEQFPKNLKAARAAAGVSQEALATRAGYTVGYLSMLENGRRSPTLATIDVLADALKISADRLTQINQ